MTSPPKNDDDRELRIRTRRPQSKAGWNDESILLELPNMITVFIHTKIIHAIDGKKPANATPTALNPPDDKR